MCLLWYRRYADKANMEVGLLFTCRLGDVDLDRPVGEPVAAPALMMHVLSGSRHCML